MLVEALLKAFAAMPPIFWLMVAVIFALKIATSFLKRKRKRGRLRPSYQHRSIAGHKSSGKWSGNLARSIRQIWQATRGAPAQSKGIDTTRWTLELLQALEWRRFELLCAAYFELLGFKAKNNDFGPDGGVDIHLYTTSQNHPAIIVQCKTWMNKAVGVNEVREFYGVMAQEKIAEGIFVTTGTFTSDGRAFPKGDDLHLIDGKDLLEKINALTHEQQRELLNLAVEGDFTTPTCASCGVKMIWRTPRRSGTPFWGCKSYPRCRQTLYQAAI